MLPGGVRDQQQQGALARFRRTADQDIEQPLSMKAQRAAQPDPQREEIRFGSLFGQLRQLGQARRCGEQHGIANPGAIGQECSFAAQQGVDLVQRFRGGVLF